MVLAWGRRTDDAVPGVRLHALADAVHRPGRRGRRRRRLLGECRLVTVTGPGGAGKVMMVTVRGTPVKLEVGATGDATGMADGLARAKAAA
jgi:hypothetical protein